METKKKKKTQISRGTSAHGEWDGRGPGRLVLEDDSSVSALLLHWFPLFAGSSSRLDQRAPASLQGAGWAWTFSVICLAL